MSDSPTINISLQSLISDFYKLRYYLFVFFILIMSGGLFYSLNLKKSIEATIEIYNISSIEFVKYEDLNPHKEIFPISQDFLRLLFIEELSDRDEIINFFDDNKILNIDLYENKREYQKDLEKKSLQVKIQKPTSQRSESSYFEGINPHLVSFVTDDKEFAIYLFDQVLNQVNLNVQKHLVYLASIKNENFQKNINLQIDHINNRIDVAKRKYLMELKNEIIFLEEQKKIAIALDLKDSGNLDFPIGDGVAIKLNQFGLDQDELTKGNDDRKKYYLKGYTAINQEIEALKSRTLIEPFVEGYNELVLEKEKLLINNELKSFNFDFKKSIINSKNFSSVNYNINDIKFKQLSSTKSSIILASLVLFFMVSIVIIIFQIILRELKQN